MAEAINWLGIAPAGGPEVTNNPVEVSAEGSEHEENTAVNAFWALLKQAGYEEL